MDRQILEIAKRAPLARLPEKKQGVMRADLHVHTNCSNERIDTFPYIRIFGERGPVFTYRTLLGMGFDFVVFTEHNKEGYSRENLYSIWRYMIKEGIKVGCNKNLGLSYPDSKESKT